MQELQEMAIWPQGREDSLEEGMETHSNSLAWRIPWTEEPGGPQSMGLQRDRHDWSNLARTHTQQGAYIQQGWEPRNPGQLTSPPGLGFSPALNHPDVSGTWRAERGQVSAPPLHPSTYSKGVPPPWNHYPLSSFSFSHAFCPCRPSFSLM